MPTDWDAIVDSGSSAVIHTNAQLVEYQLWAERQTCRHCGKRRSDRKPEEFWITERDCGCMMLL